MDHIHLIALVFVLLGQCAVSRFLLLGIVGVTGSKLGAALLVLGSAVLLYSSVASALVAGCAVFLVTEVFLAYYSAMNLFLAPQNPGDSLRSILEFNLSHDCVKNVLITILAAPISGYVSYLQRQNHEQFTHWINSPLAQWPLGIVGLVFLVLGIAVVTRVTNMIKLESG